MEIKVAPRLENLGFGAGSGEGGGRCIREQYSVIILEECILYRVIENTSSETEVYKMGHKGTVEGMKTFIYMERMLRQILQRRT